MPYFVDEEDVYRYLGALFLDLLSDEELAPQFRAANTIVQYRYRKPESQITVKLLEDDAKLGYLTGRWNEPAYYFSGPVVHSIIIILRGKVLAWMNKYREKHPARALFTGES